MRTASLGWGGYGALVGPSRARVGGVNHIHIYIEACVECSLGALVHVLSVAQCACIYILSNVHLVVVVRTLFCLDKARARRTRICKPIPCAEYATLCSWHCWERACISTGRGSSSWVLCCSELAAWSFSTFDPFFFK